MPRLVPRHLGICTFLAAVLISPRTPAQVGAFPYTQGFDSSSSLPEGWNSSRSKLPGSDDISVSQSLPRSLPNCLCASNATVAQFLTSPSFDFTDVTPEELSWYMRRSGTFNASLVLEVSLNDGRSFDIPLGDTLRPTGSLSYEQTSALLPRSFAGEKEVRFRWRIIPEMTGTSGTLRFDDFCLTVRRPHELFLGRLVSSPPHPSASDSVTITGTVKNIGTQQAVGFRLALYLDANGDSLPGQNEYIASSPPSPALESGDSVSLSVAAGMLPPGRNLMIGVISDTVACKRSWFELDIGAVPGMAVINEIMFAPLAGEAEYVEILNTGVQPLNLAGWEIRSGSGTRSLIIPAPPSLLLPGLPAVVAEDSSIFRFFPELMGPDARRVIIPRQWTIRLNNSGDNLVVSDPSGWTMDSVAYSPSWHNPAVLDKTGRSLERILAHNHSNDPANWTTSVAPEGGTPARANSVAIRSGAPCGTVVCSPSPFSPDGDGVDDATVIRYTLPQGVWSVNVRIFDSGGHRIRTLATCIPGFGRGEVLWDGRDDRRVKARMGIYIVFIEATDQVHGASFSAKGVVVLAGKL